MSDPLEHQWGPDRATPASTGEAVAPPEVSTLQAQIKALTEERDEALKTADEAAEEARQEGYDDGRDEVGGVYADLWRRLTRLLRDRQTLPEEPIDGEGYTVEDMIQAVFELESHAEARATEAERQLAEGVPDGWKLVPTEPTEAMRKAFINKRVATSPDKFDAPYAAMLAATPTPSKKPR